MRTPRLRPTGGAGPAHRSRLWMLASAALLVAAAGAVLAWSRATQDPTGTTREFSVSARRYEFTPARIEVDQDALVKIEFTAEDIPHSFTVDAYRIAKRAGAGQTVTFEFRADKPGTFRYYCNLAIDDGCRKMQGEIVVRPKKP